VHTAVPVEKDMVGRSDPAHRHLSVRSESVFNMVII